jgi:DNA polymerase bacteriophage-type
VMANAILNLEDAGLRVAFHVHDEIVLEVPIESKDEAKAEAYQILIQAPDWAPDLPLGVEGEFAESYTK